VSAYRDGIEAAAKWHDGEAVMADLALNQATAERHRKFAAAIRALPVTESVSSPTATTSAKITAALEWARQMAADSGSLVWAEHVRVLEGMARDAGRYRWLRDKSSAQWEHPIVVSQKRVDDGMQYVGPLICGALDDAIDAALPDEQEKEK